MHVAAGNSGAAVARVNCRLPPELKCGASVRLHEHSRPDSYRRSLAAVCAWILSASAIQTRTRGEASFRLSMVWLVDNTVPASPVLVKIACGPLTLGIAKC